MEKVMAVWAQIKQRPVRAAVLLFILALVFCMGALRSANANAEPVVSLGHTTFNSSVTLGEFAYRLPDSQWEVGVLAFGQGDTKRGDQPVHYGVTASYIVDPPSWPVYMRIGAGYVEDENPLIGDTNYRLGIGRSFFGGLFSVEYAHLSSAGIHNPNSGVDAVQFRLPLPSF